MAFTEICDKKLATLKHYIFYKIVQNVHAYIFRCGVGFFSSFINICTYTKGLYYTGNKFLSVSITNLPWTISSVVKKKVVKKVCGLAMNHRFCLKRMKSVDVGLVGCVLLHVWGGRGPRNFKQQ